MNHRWSELLAAETITAAGTKTVDIDTSDPITRISILVKLTNNGNTPTDHPAKAITKLEVVDGADILASLSGMEAQALSYFHTRQTPYQYLTYLDNVMAMIQLELYFGRFLHDPRFALDPKKFANPQLKITHSLASGGSAPDSMDLRVRAEVFDDKKITPEAFLMAKELISYSLSSSGNEYVDIPNDYPVRKILIMSRAASKAPHEQFNQIKLTEETDKKVLLEGYTSDIQKIINPGLPPWTDFLYGNAQTTGVAHFITPTFGCYPSLNAEGVNSAIYAEAYVNGGTKTIYGSAASNFHGLYTGHCPHGAIDLAMGDQDDPDDWWDVTKLNKGRLKITAGSSVESSSTLQVVLQQLRKY